MRKIIYICAGVALGYWFLIGQQQTVAVAGEHGFEYPGYEVQFQKPYEMQARVLARRNYTRGREADLSPVDLALGWGPMKDTTNLEQIQITQSNRFYFWKVTHFPIPRQQIEHNSANVHIIPANDAVARQLEQVDAGDVVELAGQLVNVNAADGWRWRSSMTFTDTGNGACELLWLESLRIVG